MNNRRLQLFFLLLITLITFVVNNGAIDANIMEARNLTAAREMIQKNNWLEPTMNGELRLEKPPLPTWAAAVTMYFAGENHLSLLRLPAALAAMLLVFFLFQFTGELTDDKLLPFLVAGTSATSFYIFFLARDISWDIFCHSFMIGAIWLIHKGLRSSGKGWTELTGAGILMGLSFLSKGPVSFYALLLPYLIARSFTIGWEGASDRKIAIAAMVFVTLVISFWWPVMIWILHPEYSGMIAQQESAAWLNRNTRPFYHYWSFPVQSGVWTIIAIIALCYPYARKRINQFGNYTFLALWVATSVVLLSLLPEKKERYLLPVLLPLAMLTAFYVRSMIHLFRNSEYKRSDLFILKGNAILMAAISFIAPVALYFLQKGEARPGLGMMIFIVPVFWGLAAFFAGAFLKKDPMWLWSGMVGMVLAVCLMLNPLAPGLIQKNPGYRSYQELRQRSDLKDIPFFFNGEIQGKFIEVVWAGGHEVKSWNPVTQRALPVKPPLLLISHEPPFVVLSPEILQGYRLKELGHFDTNMTRQSGNTVLSNFVTIIYLEGSYPGL